MKHKESIITWAFVFSIFMFLLLFLDVFALSDIYNDYVSTKVLDSIQLDISEQLPDWSGTKGEWNMVKISLLLKSIFMIVIIVALAKMIRKLKL